MQNWSPQILSINVYNHTDQQLAMLFFDYKVTVITNWSEMQSVCMFVK